MRIYKYLNDRLNLTMFWLLICKKYFRKCPLKVVAVLRKYHHYNYPDPKYISQWASVQLEQSGWHGGNSHDTFIIGNMVFTCILSNVLDDITEF